MGFMEGLVIGFIVGFASKRFLDDVQEEAHR